MAIPKVNPIASVAPVTYSGSSYSVGTAVSVPCPSSYTWNLEDTSSADAGRTEDGVMHKLRIGQVAGLEFGWQNTDISKINTVLKAFNPEYVQIRYQDPLSGTASNNYFVTNIFYVGNRSAVAYNTSLGIWTCSFKVVDKAGAIKT